MYKCFVCEKENKVMHMVDIQIVCQECFEHITAYYKTEPCEYDDCTSKHECPETVKGFFVIKCNNDYCKYRLFYFLPKCPMNIFRLAYILNEDVMDILIYSPSLMAAERCPACYDMDMVEMRGEYSNIIS